MNSLTAFLIFCLTLCLTATNLTAQNVTIPDANFKAFLVGSGAINTNGDGEIQVSEASVYNGPFNCSNENIADLTGIEAFVNLTIIQCYSNQLTSLDVTQNINLITLDCYSNQLTSLDVTQNTSLTRLHCQGNQLGSLDVSQNTSLEQLRTSNNPIMNLDVTQNTNLWRFYCNNNQLSSLDVTQNTNLTEFRCTSNQLTNLDVTQNTSLIDFYCSNNQILVLDMSQNTSLVKFNCTSNQLTSLDVSQNVNLVELYCSFNLIMTLDASQNSKLTKLYCIDNQMTDLNVSNGNNTNMDGVYFNTTTNPNLSCIQVDDSIYSVSNWTSVDATSFFNIDCSLFSTVNTISKDINLSAYPNPTTKTITLDFGKLYQEVNLQVSNLTGQIILNRTLENISNTSLKLEGAAGVYFVSIQTEEGTTTLKVIKE